MPLPSAILDIVVHHGDALLVPIHFGFGSATSVGWKGWIDQELSNVGFMETLQWVGVLKAILYSWSLHNFHNKVNL